MTDLDRASATLGELRAVELFAELTDEQLAWLATQGTRMEFADGAVLFEDGEEGRYFYVLLVGGLLITKVIGGEPQVMNRYFARPDGAPDNVRREPDGMPTASNQYVGELPMLDGGCYVAQGAAIGRTEVIAYDKSAFFDILARCPQVCRILLPVLAWRIRNYERKSGHNAMLEGLGTLAAGLAHELNNPSAAIVRAGDELTSSLISLAEWGIRWGSQATLAEREAVSQVAVDCRGGTSDPLTAPDAADQLVALLESRGVGEAAELAFMLADCGVAPEVLSALDVRAESFESAVAFLAYSAQTVALAKEVAEGSRRIEALIGQVKRYTNVGRASLQDVRLAEGLDATLAMLSPKLDGIRLRREYTDLPAVSGYPSELNQVWTNLIVNAADAMGASGELRVRIFRDGDCAAVEICDSGPGIGPEILPKLFQPFFTTKDIGKGTGLGLHLSRDIVVHRHNGHIDVTSVPGDTRFRVRLPLKQEAGQLSGS